MSRLIERNLNAICRSPKLHRLQVLEYVHSPTLKKLHYSVSTPLYAPVHRNSTLENVLFVCQGVNIREDPYIVRLLQNPDTPGNNERLAKALCSGQTYSQEQLKALCTKGLHVYEELGQWAADHFVATSIARFKTSVAARNEVLLGLEDEEKAYLLHILDKVEIEEAQKDFVGGFPSVSPKVERLIELLVQEGGPLFSGLIFAQQRVVVAVLSHLLRVHPLTKQLFDCASFVGSSSSPDRKKSIAELLDPREQRDTLDEFRQGKKNLLIATSVLEEGMDIPACHLIICFDKPTNLKSFVQRRGRARREKSTFVLMLAEEDQSVSVHKWHILEEEMKRIYQDDMRKLQEAAEKESLEEEGLRVFTVPSTGWVPLPFVWMFSTRKPC